MNKENITQKTLLAVKILLSDVMLGLENHTPPMNTRVIDTPETTEISFSKDGIIGI